MDATFRDRDDAEHDALASADQFSPVRPSCRVVLNSLPKSGTVLFRNVLLHFFGTAGSEVKTIEPKAIEQFSSFNELFSEDKVFFPTHLPLYPQSSAFIRSMGENTRMLLLIRHPLENSYSYARHLMRPGQRRFNPLSKYIYETNAPLEEVVYYCIRGYGMGKAGEIEGVVRRYMHYVAWAALGAKLVKYEDLTRAGADLESDFSRAFFGEIASFLGFALPNDWRQRVVAAFAPEKSWTYAYLEPGAEKYPKQLFFSKLLSAEAESLLKFLGYDRHSF